MKALRLLLLALVILGLASGCRVETPQVTAEPTRTVAITSTSTAETIPSSTTEVNPSEPAPTTTTALPTATLKPDMNSVGPWLVFNSDQGLQAVNPDGSGLQPLKIHIPDRSADLDRFASHGSAWLAFFMGSPGDFPPKDLILSVVHLPDRFIIPFAPMFSQDIQAQIHPPDRPPEAVVAVTDPDLMAWSPDGTKLAFVAAIDGPSSDLYLFTPDGEKLDRLTDGPTEAATPFWSPDGKWIVHQGVETFGTGAGWNVAAVWAATADNSQVKKVYDAAGSGGEVFLGWADNEMYAVCTWTAEGLKNLRLVNINSGEVTKVYGDYFGSAAFDEVNGTFAFTASIPGTPLEPGVYLATGTGAPELIKAGNWTRVEWSKSAGKYFAMSPEGMLSFSSKGDVVQFPNERWALASPDGGRVAFWGNAQFGDIPGVRLYYADGSAAGSITDDSVDRVIWRPDGTGLFYVSNGALYYVDVPGGVPRMVTEGVEAGQDWGIGWVW